MLRADNVICGTSSTGTGTLTLAACPSPPGGLDFYQWLTATGLNFVSTNAVLVSYTIIEYTDATFATAKQTEKGIGTLTLGASLTASTLARTTVQSKVLTMNATPALTVSAPTAITIGTAANTLVFVGASVADILPSFGPYFADPNSSGIPPLGMLASQNTGTLTNGGVDYVPFYWHVPMLVKKIGVAVGGSAYTGGTSQVYAAIYQNNSSGQPGKLLIDFGALGAGTTVLSSTFAPLYSASHASGFWLAPGLYWAAFFTSFSGGSGTPNLSGFVVSPNAYAWNLGSWISGMSSASPLGGKLIHALATASANPAPDPATLTAYFAHSVSSGTPNGPNFTLGP